MIQQEIKLVMSDIDGTILTDKHEVDHLLKEQLQQLKKQKIPFVLASARSPKGMYPLAEELNISDYPMACYNGALVLKHGLRDDYSPIFSHELNKEAVTVIVDVLKTEYPKIAVNLYSGEDWYVNELNQWVKIEQAITKEAPIEKNLQVLISESVIPIHKLLLIGEPEEIQEVMAFCQTLHLEECAFYLSKDNYLEVTNKEVSKEKALIELTNYYALDLQQTMTIGDNFNDIPMLSLAGLGVSMSNAPKEVQDSADVITVSNNENGVTEALKKFVVCHD